MFCWVQRVVWENGHLDDFWLSDAKQVGKIEEFPGVVQLHSWWVLRVASGVQKLHGVVQLKALLRGVGLLESCDQMQKNYVTT